MEPSIPLPLWRRMFVSRGAQMGIDGLLAGLALALAYLLRFDGWPPSFYVHQALRFLPWFCAARLACHYFGHAYRRIWRYTSIAEALQMLRLALLPSLALLLLRLNPAVGNSWNNALRLPVSVIIIDYMLFVGGAMGVRLVRRMLAERGDRIRLGGSHKRKRVVLFGAGAAGVMVAREFAMRPDLNVHVLGFLDDEPLKRGAVIHNLPVLGGLSDLPRVVAAGQVQEVIVTMASVPARTIRSVVEACEQSHVPVRIVPGLFEILDGTVSTSSLHPVEIEDLLGRPSFDIGHWLEACRPFYQGQRVLITGGGGSIGRELCRQLTVIRPAQVILLDKDENSVFEAMQDLASSTSLVRPVIADLRQRERLQAVLRELRPTMVFHAAAHKHVHLMEQNPCEAVMNNIGGTANLLASIPGSGIRHCVMVSTDKAVNPTNIMGATKRVSELMFQAAALAHPETEYCCVRFGNVLGSRGSVVPIFRQQIARGGPITITHPDVTRYFMTIPEAAHLIVQAAILGRQGGIFLLDMGKPVRILDLARDMIHLSGLQAGEDGDVPIEFIGLRPGEKLHEELLIHGEGVGKTSVDKIFISSPAQYPLSEVADWTERLLAAARADDSGTLLAALDAMDIGFSRRARAVAVG